MIVIDCKCQTGRVYVNRQGWKVHFGAFAGYAQAEGPSDEAQLRGYLINPQRPTASREKGQYTKTPVPIRLVGGTGPQSRLSELW